MSLLSSLMINNLTWYTHIDPISKRLSRVIILFRRLFCYVLIIIGFFQSIIRYGLIMQYYFIWNKTLYYQAISNRVVSYTLYNKLDSHLISSTLNVVNSDISISPPPPKSTSPLMITNKRLDGVWPFLLNVKFHLHTNVLSKSYTKISKDCLLRWAYLVVVTLAERMEGELRIETGKVYRLTGCVKFVYQLFSKLSRMFRGLDHRIHSLRMKHSKTLQSLLNNQPGITWK